ncbi:MAG TPA: BsuPI-related putative proteinase inhibitor [Candidatus Krumholzibacteria bacterium]|nr:BsuPI-related putative proteinase inhibitor [Candidatus Krumholzibacteria bacterium]
MQLRRVIVHTCMLAAIVAMAGCAGHVSRGKEPPMPLPPGISPAPGGLKFSVKITPARFKLGEHVALEATMFNDSDKKFERRFPTSCVWDYQVAGDLRILGPHRMCLQTVTDLALEPGELRVISRDWRGNARYFEVDESLAPGTYQVTAGLIQDGQVVPMSDPVTIEILPR